MNVGSLFQHTDGATGDVVGFFASRISSPVPGAVVRAHLLSVTCSSYHQQQYPLQNGKLYMFAGGFVFSIIMAQHCALPVAAEASTCSSSEQFVAVLLLLLYKQSSRLYTSVAMVIIKAAIAGGVIVLTTIDLVRFYLVMLMALLLTVHAAYTVYVTHMSNLIDTGHCFLPGDEPYLVKLPVEAPSGAGWIFVARVRVIFRRVTCCSGKHVFENASLFLPALSNITHDTKAF